MTRSSTSRAPMDIALAPSQSPGDRIETKISMAGRLIYLGSRPRRFARAWRHRSGSSRRICLSGACILRSRRRPLAYVAEDAVVLYPRVVGAPLSERLQRPGAGVAECLERAGAALHALHHLPTAVAGPLKLHDFAAEVSEIAREASDHIPALLPSVGPAIEGLLARAGELHERLSPEPPTFTHGDFKSEHIWAAPGGFTLTDFDGCRLADPAYDVGKFLADLQLWFTAYDQEGLEQVQEQFLAGYAPRAPQERLLRARLYDAVQLVKIARSVPLVDLDWAALTKQVIRRAQAVMNDLELTLGLPATPSFLGFLDWSHNRHRTRRERRRQRCRKGAWG